jgi:hypothetical protein
MEEKVPKGRRPGWGYCEADRGLSFISLFVLEKTCHKLPRPIAVSSAKVDDAETKKICQERIHMHILLVWKKKGVLMYTTKQTLWGDFLGIYVLLTGLDHGEEPMKRCL